MNQLFKYIWVAAVAIVLLCHSCFSVKYSMKGGSMPSGVRTFSVQYVENQARIVEPGLSQQVTDALKDYMQRNTNLIMVNNNADIDFKSVIVGYEPSTPATIVAGDQAAQNKFSITVKVKYSCNVDPELDFENSFNRYKLYNVESDFENVRADLTEEIINEILDDIFKKAFANW